MALEFVYEPVLGDEFFSGAAQQFRAAKSPHATGRRRDLVNHRQSQPAHYSTSSADPLVALARHTPVKRLGRVGAVAAGKALAGEGFYFGNPDCALSTVCRWEAAERHRHTRIAQIKKTTIVQ